MHEFLYFVRDYGYIIFWGGLLAAIIWVAHLSAKNATEDMVAGED